jgi:hypothetical protein
MLILTVEYAKRMLLLAQQEWLLMRRYQHVSYFMSSMR